MHDPSLRDTFRPTTEWERESRNAQVRFLDTNAAVQRMSALQPNLDKDLLLELELALRASHQYYRAYDNVKVVSSFLL
jgi:hypothetical protein